MADDSRGRNWSTRNEISRALDILSAAEQDVLRHRFDLGETRGNTKNVVSLFGNTQGFTERRALRKLRRASMQKSLAKAEYGVGSWYASRTGIAPVNPTFRQDWPASFFREPEAWLGGSGADWWDEA